MISAYRVLLWQGLATTIALWSASLVLAMLLGVIFGLLRCEQLRVPGMSKGIDALTLVLRGIPFYVQLLIVYFALPACLPFSLSPSQAGVWALGCCSAAYVSQMVKGGMDALGKDPWEASFVLGYNKRQTLRVIVLPQLLRMLLPMFVGEGDQLLKSTAVISTIGVVDITRAGLNIINTEMNPVPVYAMLAVVYLGLSILWNGLGSALQWRMAR